MAPAAQTGSMATELPESKFAHVFDTIYGVDLVFKPGCWALCSDAHCCHFSRYKSASDAAFHEIPLLPGEWAYLNRTGHIRQYENYRQLKLEVPLTTGILAYESLRIPATQCPCTHDIRPTICRLYPLLPVYSPTAGFVGVDTRVTLFDVIEEVCDLPRVCRIEEVPFSELQKFMQLTRALGSEPVLVFHLIAYKLVKDTLRRYLLQMVAAGGRPSGSREDIAERITALQRDLVVKAVNWGAVKSELNELGNQFRALHGASFTLS
jgi:hypothetical protein